MRNFYSYCTNYTYRLDGPCSNEEWASSCFHSLFDELDCLGRDAEPALEVEIYIAQQPAVSPIRTDLNNFVYLTHTQIEKYLTYLASLVPFTFEINPSNDIKSSDRTILMPYLEIILNFDTTTSVRQKEFVLTMARWLWELPYAAFLQDAMRLKDANYFPDMDLFSLLNLIFASHTFSSRNDQYLISGKYAMRAVTKAEIEEISTMNEHWETTLEERKFIIEKEDVNHKLYQISYRAPRILETDIKYRDIKEVTEVYSAQYPYVEAIDSQAFTTLPPMEHLIDRYNKVYLPNVTILKEIFDKYTSEE